MGGEDAVVGKSEEASREDSTPATGDDLGLDGNEELRVGDASMNADRGEG